MGKPIPLYDVEIQRDDGTRCNTGETGEICIRMDPRPAGIMMEYYRQPGAHRRGHPRRVVPHTGDTAWCDRGRLLLVQWAETDDVIKFERATA